MTTTLNTRALLSKLVSIPSPVTHEQKISEFVLGYVRNLGFSVKTVTTGKDRQNIIATLGSADHYLGFYGHLDTVEPDKDFVTPYKLRVHAYKAQGIGVNNMKAGVTAILKMAEYAAKHKLPVMLIFGLDEENISEGVHDIIDSGLVDKLNFLIVGESGLVVNFRQPYNVGYGRRGRILFDIEVFGKPTHAAEAYKGVNAIEQAAILIRAMNRIKFKRDKELGDSEFFFQGIHSSTESFTVPDYCLIQCSVLTNSVTTGTQVQREIRNLADSLGIKVSVVPHPRPTPYTESYKVDRQHPFLKRLEAEIFKGKIEPVYSPSLTDENVFANRLQIPVITIGAIGAEDHTKDEWVDLKSLDEVVEVYKKVIQLYHSHSALV